MPFQPGNKIGRGRPKGSGRVQILKEWTESHGWKRLIAIAEGKGYRIGRDPQTGKVVEVGPSQELQFEALKLALAYGHGKPTEHVDLTSNGETARDVLLGWARSGPTDSAADTE